MISNIFEPLQGYRQPEHIKIVASYPASELIQHLANASMPEIELLSLVHRLESTGAHDESTLRAYTKYAKVRKERELKELNLEATWNRRKRS